MLSNPLIPDSIFPNYTTQPSQHFYLRYTHFMHVLFSNRPTFYSISHSWCNRSPVKNFHQSCWFALTTKHSRSRSLLHPTHSCPVFSIFINLSTYANYRAKVSEWISLWYLLSSNPHGSFPYMIAKYKQKISIVTAKNISNACQIWLFFFPFHPHWIPKYHMAEGFLIFGWL